MVGAVNRALTPLKSVLWHASTARAKSASPANVLRQGGSTSSMSNESPIKREDAVGLNS
jgi:hypothetical protein